MLKRVGRLFVIKSRMEAYVVIYALAVGGVERGVHYVDQFPGIGGYLLFLACTGTVFMAGAKILDGVPSRRRPAGGSANAGRRRDDWQRPGLGQERRGEDRRRQDRRQPGGRAADRRQGERRASAGAQAARERPA